MVHMVWSLHIYFQFGLKGEDSLPINDFMKNLSLAPVYRVSPLQPGM